MDSKGRLWIAARAVLIVSLVTQLLTIAYYWWDLDPRVLCGRLLYWRDWLHCIHGSLRIDVKMLEIAIGVWLIAGLAMLLGRFLPAFISMLLPLLLAIAAIWAMVEQLQEHISIYGGLTFSDVLRFVGNTALGLILLAGPVTGAWLMGMHRRL